MILGFLIYVESNCHESYEVRVNNLVQFSPVQSSSVGFFWDLSGSDRFSPVQSISVFGRVLLSPVELD